jgi:hypothetical protein
MKRSSARRARRWVIQELTRCLDQHNDPLLYQTRSIDSRTDALRVRAANNVQGCLWNRLKLPVCSIGEAWLSIGISEKAAAPIRRE